MPWTAADAKKHTGKADTPAKQKTWAEVANSALKRCKAEGRSQGDCEASAIKQANSAIANIKEHDMAYRGYFTSGTATVEIRAIELDGEPVPVSELVDAYQEQRGQGQGTDGLRQEDSGAAVAGKQEEMSEAVWTTAFVNDLPDSCFALIEPGGEKDEEGKTKPRSLRHLPYKDADGTVDAPHLRNALSRLPQLKGVAAGLISKALKKLQAVAKKHLKTYQKEMQALDLAVALVESFEVEFEEDEAQLIESASGHAVALAEGQTDYSNSRAPLLIDVALIKPGFGNKQDKHYYPRDVLRRDAKVFEGVKMYATDHRPEEKNVKTEVAVIKACPVAFADDGTPIARAAVHDGDFAEQARNRAKLGTLETLECSILALGKTKKGEIDGQEANIVEAITKGQSVDWVTKAGAGGHAISLAENDGGETMSEQEKDKNEQAEEASQEEAQTQEAILTEQGQAQQQEAPQTLAEAEVEKVVGATKLPDFIKASLKARLYKDEAELKETVEEATKEVAKLAGAGQPFGQGSSESTEEKPLSERERIIRFNKHLEAVGGRPVPVPAEQ